LRRTIIFRLGWVVTWAEIQTRYHPNKIVRDACPVEISKWVLNSSTASLEGRHCLVQLELKSTWKFRSLYLQFKEHFPFKNLRACPFWRLF
jgi:hypothetical protein